MGFWAQESVRIWAPAAGITARIPVVPVSKEFDAKLIHNSNQNARYNYPKQEGMSLLGPAVL